jgi:hypothetical protein
MDVPYNRPHYPISCLRLKKTRLVERSDRAPSHLHRKNKTQ